MVNSPQYLGNLLFHPISWKGSSYIRISPKIISELNWDKKHYDMYGIFRSNGELLCAPKNLISEKFASDFTDIKPP